MLLIKFKYFLSLKFSIMKALITSLLFSSFLFFLINPASSLATEVNIGWPKNTFIDRSVAVDEDVVATFTMEVSELKNGKPTKNDAMRMTYYLNGEEIAIKPEMDDKQETVMIYNTESQTITTLIDQKGEKSGMKMKMPKMKMNSEDMDDIDFTVTPTDETKTIQGYECKKYLIESSDYTGHAWITEEVDINFQRIFSFLNNKKKGNSKMPKFGNMDGFAMETYSKNKKKDEEYLMKIVDLKVGEVDESIFDTSGYAITDMSNLMNMGGER